MATILGTDGDDELVMIAAGDTLYGRAGNDALLATFDLGVLNGGTGDDRLVAQDTGGHRMQGGDGNDTFELTESSGNDVRGGADQDVFTVVGGFGHSLRGGQGYDLFSLFQVQDVEVWTGPGGGFVDLTQCENIRINGSAEVDNFQLWFDNRNLTIHAGAGNDSFDMADLFLGLSASFISGGAGDDSMILTGVGYGSTLNGDSGNDSIRITGGSASTVNGGTGDDDIAIGYFMEFFTVNGGAGNDNLFADSSWGCVLDGGAGGDVIFTSGRPTGSGSNLIYGGTGDDALTIAGESGDQVYGEAGDDRISSLFTYSGFLDGGDGDDQFDFAGALGNVVTGGRGSDVYAFDFNSRDNTITDFDRVAGGLSPVEDRFDFTQMGLPDISLDQLVQDGYLSVDASANVTGGAARDSVVRVDPDGTAGMELAATVIVTAQDVVLGTTGADADNWLV